MCYGAGKVIHLIENKWKAANEYKVIHTDKLNGHLCGCTFHVSTHAMANTFTLIRRFDNPECEELSRLGGLKHDLERVVAYCHVLESISPAPTLKDSAQKLHMWEVITIGCIVQYARCFSSGVRRPLSLDFLSDAPDEIRNNHEYFYGIRDKHIAHSVNYSEDNSVMVEFEMNGVVPQQALHISTRSHRLIAIGDAEIPLLKELAHWVLAKLSIEYQKEISRVEMLVKKIPPADLINLDIAPRSSFFQHTKLLKKSRKNQ